MTEEDLVPASDGRARTLRRDLWRNLRSGLRVACLLGANRAGFVATWTQLALLIALSAAVTLWWQIAEVGWAGELQASGLPGALFFVPVVIVAAWAMAAVAGRAGETLALAIAILGANLWIDAAAGIVHFLAGHAPRGLRGPLSWAAYYLYNGWLAACAGVAGARMLATTWPRRLAAAAIAFVLVGYAQFAVEHDDRLWAKRPDPVASERQRYAAVASEDVLYLQPRLLDSQLGALWPRREGRPNLYLVSVAGYADQDVFMREVNAVDALFAERFGTRGRSVKLVNNRATVRELPLATRTSLSWTLQRLGTLMDREEDILFLFLTSHGTRNTFSLEFPPLRLTDLSATELRQMLDESGIRNRVIVVSSCYSGSFIEALRDDRTLVMTASARDRNSFGCSNGADFTYFGKAYFDEALRGTDSFSEAFDRALPAIAAREKKEDYTPSDPQRYAGPGIGARLAALREADTRDGAGTPPANAVAPAPSDPYARLARTWLHGSLEQEYYVECRKTVESSSPEAAWRRDPGYFGGVTPASAQWPRLETAWARYVEAACKPVADRDFYERALTDGYRTMLGEKDLAAVLAFMETPAGKRFVAAQHAVSMTAWREAGDRQREVAGRAGADYARAVSEVGEPRTGPAKEGEKGLKAGK